MKNIITTLKLTALTLLVCSVIYPLAVLVLAGAIFPEKAEGNLVRNAAGQIIGSRLIAQRFASLRYFWPRPSAVNYNGEGAGGSNLAPTNPALAGRAGEILGKYALPVGAEFPADLATASGSGLDPHISEAAACLQAPRVALARGASLDEVRGVISKKAFAPDLLHPAHRIVNVLEINLILDSLPAASRD